MIKTSSMMNPKCQECSKRDTCNNKTLCAYLYEDNIEPIGVYEKVVKDALEPIILTPEMVREQLVKDLINKSIGCDTASLMGLRSD